VHTESACPRGLRYRRPVGLRSVPRVLGLMDIDAYSMVLQFQLFPTKSNLVW
jgi:hypothetical protein